MAKICDYSGFNCDCKGYKRGEDPIFKTLCICGHAKSQHVNDVIPEQVSVPYGDGGCAIVDRNELENKDRRPMQTGREARRKK